MKKFDINKFIKTLITPKEHPIVMGSPSDYKNEFGLNTKKSYFSRIRRITTALEDSGYEEILEPRGNYYPFSKVDNIEKDFIRLDKSFKYSPILQIRDVPVPDDAMYYYEEEHGYLSTKKSEYSFLLGVDAYNNNFALEVIEVFKNIKKKDIKKLSQKVIKNIKAKYWHYCKLIILNNLYIWGSDSENKALISKLIVPSSLKKFFLPILKNKIKFSKECGGKPSDIKKINSMICILNENKIKKKPFFPSRSKLVELLYGKKDKGEVCEYLLNPNRD